MEAKRIEISALFRVGHKKVDIFMLQNIILSAVKRVTYRLKNNKSLKNRPRSWRP